MNLFSQDILDSKFSMSSPYVFPPFNLIAPVVRFLTTGVWFPSSFYNCCSGTASGPVLVALVNGFCVGKVAFGLSGDLGVLKFLSKSGLRLVPSPVSLWACRVSRI